MKRYSEFELAEIIKNSIDKKYSNPNKIADEFKTILKNHVKLLSNNTILLEDEMNEKKLMIATSIFNDLHKIKAENIKGTLSRELLNRNFIEGIEISEYTQYFETSAKEIVQKFIQLKIARVKKQISELKRKKKR